MKTNQEIIELHQNLLGVLLEKSNIDLDKVSDYLENQIDILHLEESFKYLSDKEKTGRWIEKYYNFLQNTELKTKVDALLKSPDLSIMDFLKIAPDLMKFFKE
jgi:uncharacterized protein YpuA (DUF1002 family)